MLMRQGPFFPCLVPPSEPTNSSVDVWAICTQHARRETESKLLWRLGVCIISHPQKEKKIKCGGGGSSSEPAEPDGVIVIHLKIKWAVWGFRSKGGKLRAYKISLGLHCRKGAHYFPNWQACRKQKKEKERKKEKVLCVWGMLLQNRYLCATNFCLRTPKKKEKDPTPPPEQKQRNQGHLRTACQLLFFLAILCSMCAGKARISTTTNNHFLRLSEHIQLHFRRQICTVMTARWFF